MFTGGLLYNTVLHIVDLQVEKTCVGPVAKESAKYCGKPLLANTNTMNLEKSKMCPHTVPLSTFTGAPITVYITYESHIYHYSYTAHIADSQ